MRWDVFVSHASEDKATVAVPLTEALKRRGLRVWLDRQELRLGDSLREKIDNGLAESSFGALVISPAFLGKRWPTRELNGLVAIETAGRKAMLPVWHGIDHDTLVRYSPILADRVAANTADGIDRVADAITSTVLAEPDSAAPTLSRLLLDVLNDDDRSRIGEFLAAHPSILQGVFGASWNKIRRNVEVAGTTIDLCVGSFEPTPRAWVWQGVALASVSQSPVDDTGAVQPHVRELATARSAIARNWALRLKRALPGQRPVGFGVIRGLTDAGIARGRAWLDPEALPDFSSKDFRLTILAGRRHALSHPQAGALSEFNDMHTGVQIRSYDWLIDAM